MHFSLFLCISLHFSASLCIYLHFYAYLCILLHFSAFVFISLFFLCISLHFSLCILVIIFVRGLGENIDRLACRCLAATCLLTNRKDHIPSCCWLLLLSCSCCVTLYNHQEVVDFESEFLWHRRLCGAVPEQLLCTRLWFGARQSRFCHLGLSSCEQCWPADKNNLPNCVVGKHLIHNSAMLEIVKFFNMQWCHITQILILKEST